jgi:hypothetical protein
MDKLEKLVDKDKYQVFFLMSSAALPFITFRHTWVVTNEKGILTRYEIRHTKNKDSHLKHFFINANPPFQGIPLIFHTNFLFQPTTLLKLITGDADSETKRIVDFIKESPNTYPFTQKYSFIGPNCSTYVEWIIDHFPDIKVVLPWNAVGKNYSKIRL